MGGVRGEPSQHWEWLVAATFLCLPVTFVITYIWAVMNEHVEPNFPYISSAGTHPPESCFFGQMFNISAVLIGCLVWVRHELIEDYCCQRVTHKSLPRWNKISSFFGYTSAIGVSFVGNFQANKFSSIHLFGAFLAFGIGNLFIWMEAVMSYQLVPHLNSTFIAHVRIACAIVASAMNIVTVVFSYLHTVANKGDVVYWSEDPKWWYQYRNHWDYHVLATSSEWVLAGALCTYMLTLIPEFKRITIKKAVVELDRDRKQSRSRSQKNYDSNSSIINSRL